MSGMPRPPGAKDPDAWTLDLASPLHTSVCSLNGAYINKDGTVDHNRENEDRYYSCRYGDLQLYMVLDGHDGSRACEFAQKHLPSMLCRSAMGDNGEHVMAALRLAFKDTEEQFFVALDHLILQKLAIQDQIQAKATTSLQAALMFPTQVEELQRLQDQIKGGTTAVVALILNNTHLWVANVGDSRAVLCYLDGEGKLCAEQISEDHNTQNERELARLHDCGLDENQLRRAGRLGVQQNTRSIGDYNIKGGYKDMDLLSGAHKEPGTAEPFISSPHMDITAVRGFLLLMSDGLYEAYGMCTKSMHTVNQDLGLLVQSEMNKCTDLYEVAQRVVQHVKDTFYSMLINEQRSSRMDDITLVIRNLGYSLGSQARPPQPVPRPVPQDIYTAPPSQHNPFDFSQSPHRGYDEFHPQQSMIEPGTAHRPRAYAYHQLPPGHQWHPPEREQFRHMHAPDPNSQLSMRRSGSDPNIPQYLAGMPLPPSSGAMGGGYPPQYANYPQYPPPHPQQPSYYPPTSQNPQYPPSSHVATPSVQPNAYLPSQPHPPTSQAPQYPPSTYKPAAGGQPGTHLSTHPRYYENVEDVRNQIRRRSTGDEGFVAEAMDNMQIGPPPQIPPRAPLDTQVQPVKEPPVLLATNADPQYQTDQSVLPPPTPDQPPATLHQAPNSVPSSPPVATSAAIRPQLSSGTNDEQWMYGEPSGRGDAPPEDNAPTPMQEMPKFPDKTVTAANHESPDGGGGEVVGEENKEVEPENGLHVAVLNMTSEEVSDVSEGEEEEDGMIKPIIKFDKFPADLSWEDI